MTTLHSTQTSSAEQNYSFSQSLQSEARELETLNSGLKRHVTAWRSAHDSAVTQLSAVLARMDSILERIERNRN